MVHRWLRGNLHTHTTESDGDSAPEVVVAWYRDNGYDFLAVTDHNVLTHPDGLRGAAGQMLLIRGEELTPDDVHLNGLGIGTVIDPARHDDPATELQANADLVRAQGGVPSVNHPNFRWTLSAAAIGALRDVRLFEIYNGGPESNNLGGSGRPSIDGIWDGILTAGVRLFGIAVDDAHHFRVWGRLWSNPGRGWVMVRAERPTEAAVLEALEAGECYASAGVTLEDVDVAGAELCIDIATFTDLAYQTTFIGRGGVTLDVVDGSSPRYRLTGSEGYVRARVDDSDGNSAWVQPRFLG